jgi:hypothetical protein
MPDAKTPERTTLRDGRYVLLARLGEGAQGETWDAVDKREGRAVAIKRFDVRGARAWKDVELAEREARVLAALSHPKLPEYVEHFEEDGALYLVMEKITGEPLSRLKQNGPVDEAEVLRLLRDADEILAYLHGRSPSVVHRDLKPSNVIRRDDGSFAFVDFGAVRDRMRPEGGSTVVGTFGYMAPEQFQGRAGPGSDVYAIGATALAMLTGEEPEKLPHRGLAIDVDAALARTRTSRALRDALAQMLEPDPDKRPTRIAPLLAQAPAPAPSPRRERTRDRGRDRLRDEIRDRVHEAKREAKRARREMRDERRAARRPTRLPWIIALVFVLGLTVAQIAVVLALRVAVPIVLTLLSIVFGRGLRDAAGAVSTAGTRASEAIARARVAVGERDESNDARIRVEQSSSEERVRVGDREEHDDDEQERKEELSPRARRAR